MSSRLATVFPSHIEALHRLLLDPLTDDDVQALAMVLGKVRDHMRKNPKRSPPLVAQDPVGTPPVS